MFHTSCHRWDVVTNPSSAPASLLLLQQQLLLLVLLLLVPLLPLPSHTSSTTKSSRLYTLPSAHHSPPQLLSIHPAFPSYYTTFTPFTLQPPPPLPVIAAPTTLNGKFQHHRVESRHDHQADNTSLIRRRFGGDNNYFPKNLIVILG